MCTSILFHILPFTFICFHQLPFRYMANEVAQHPFALPKTVDIIFDATRRPGSGRGQTAPAGSDHCSAAPRLGPIRRATASSPSLGLVSCSLVAWRGRHARTTGREPRQRGAPTEFRRRRLPRRLGDGRLGWSVKPSLPRTSGRDRNGVRGGSADRAVPWEVPKPPALFPNKRAESWKV